MDQSKQTKEVLISIGNLLNDKLPNFSGSKQKGDDPFHTTLSPGVVRQLKNGDSESNILAKIFILLSTEQKNKKQQDKQIKLENQKYKKLQEKRNDDLISFFSGEKKEEKSKFGLKGILIASTAIGAMLYSKDISAMIQDLDFEKLFDLKDLKNGLDDIEKLINNISFIEPMTFAGGGPADSSAYDALFKKYEQKEGLPSGLLKSLAKAESGFDPRAKSPAGALGLMQLMPGTAEQYGTKKEDIYDPEKNIQAGSRYLKHLIDKFGDVNIAIAAYNTGEYGEYGKMYAQGKIPAIKETQQHIKKVLGFWGETRNPEMASPDLQGLKMKSGANAGYVHESIVNLGKTLQSDPNLPGGYNRTTALNENDENGADSSHVHGSKHYQGLAMDYTLQDPSKSADAEKYIRNLLQSMGLSYKDDFYTINEYINKTAKTSGGHIHIQFSSPEAAEKFKLRSMQTNLNNIQPNEQNKIPEKQSRSGYNANKYAVNTHKTTIIEKQVDAPIVLSSVNDAPFFRT